MNFTSKVFKLYRHYSKTAINKAFPALNELTEKSASHADRDLNFAKSKQLKQEYTELLAAFEAGGGPKAVDRHVNRNKKLLVKDRISNLFDNVDDVLEISPTCGFELEYGTIPKGGSFVGIGKVHGTNCIAIATDATVKGGTMYPISVRKQLRAQEIAQENCLPTVYLVDSGGAFLPLQADIFTPGGRVFYNEAVMNSLGIPQLAVVCGSCTAGAAYIPTMAQEAVIVDRIGTIFLGGPPLVYAALGEIVSPEKLGGATMHSSVSGCTDYHAQNEEDAFATARSSVAAFNLDPDSHAAEWEEPVMDPEELGGIIPHNGGSLEVKQVIGRLVDGSRFHEFKATYGTDMVAGFARIKGDLIGIVANQGETSSKGAEKGAHFVQLCTQRQLPIVFFHNSNQGDLLRAQAKMMHAVACSHVPKISVILTNSIGVENYLMCGRSFGPRFVFMWPNATISACDEQHFLPSLPQETAEQSLATFRRQCSASYAAARLWNDGIVLPENTRTVLGQCLDVFKQQRSFLAQTIPLQSSVMRM